MLYKRFDFNNTLSRFIIRGINRRFCMCCFQTSCILLRLFKQLTLFQNYGSDLFKRNYGSEKRNYSNVIELATSFKMHNFFFKKSKYITLYTKFTHFNSLNKVLNFVKKIKQSPNFFFFLRKSPKIFVSIFNILKLEVDLVLHYPTC